MYRVYGDMLSGNCYKVKLILEFLSLPHTWEHVDILAGATRTREFLARNSNGKIPVLQIDDRECLSESNAILNYLAEGSSWLPDSRLHRARVLQWQFFEQYSHEPYIAVARYINRYLGLPEERLAEYYSKQEGGRKALLVMEQQLQESTYLTGEAPTIADISLYAYTHVAHEGGFELADYPALRAWLQRFSELPGYLPMSAELA
ncbi:MAG: glutathione S-transferase family protein [Gammaproteobacteria bacterium]|nr:glutathione S-transferase family protein [Pseudomonadales bacterium]MCP5347733.1 glutathione S-transferase family protein [Pseudomonadales bacterium]